MQATPDHVAASAAAGVEQAAAQAVPRYLTFAIGPERCATDIGAIREIIEVPQLTPVPMVPAVVRGVMNLRGAVVPVIDLSARLGLGCTEIGRRSCVVIVELGEGRGRQILGVLVDAVQEVLEVPAAEVEPVPELGTRIHPELIHGMAKIGDRLVTLLDLARVLAEAELTRMVAGHAAH